MTSATIVGRLTKDIEVLYRDEKPIIKSCVVSNERLKKDGKIYQNTLYMNFIITGKRAQVALNEKESFVKSALVWMDGSLLQGTFQKNGARNAYIQLVVRQWSFLSQAEFSDEVLKKIDEYNKWADEFCEITEEQMQKLIDEATYIEEMGLNSFFDANGNRLI